MPLINPSPPPTWTTLTPAAKFTTTETVQVCKQGEIVYMRGQVAEVNTSGIALWDTVLTLPAGFRPAVKLTGLAVDPAGAFGARLDILTTGVIQVFWDPFRGYPGYQGNKIYLNFANVIFPTW